MISKLKAIIIISAVVGLSGCSTFKGIKDDFLILFGSPSKIESLHEISEQEPQTQDITKNFCDIKRLDMEGNIKRVDFSTLDTLGHIKILTKRNGECWLKGSI